MFTVDTSTSESQIKRKAEEIADNIRRTGIVEVNGVKFDVSEVSVFNTQGIISGWNVFIHGEEDAYRAVIFDRGERSYARIHLTRPGIVLAIGEDVPSGRAAIIYRD